MKSLTPQQFSKKLIDWHAQHGRKDLPWQKNTTPYRVWLSEIMLQQTQVNTVIPYFNRFLKRFPSIKTLAESSIDDVLCYWSGLGYYARARNLHRCAEIIFLQYCGKFPEDLNQLISLPGIGRSTAGAILSLSKNIPAPILDGNVKRVLTRFYAVEGWPGSPKTSRKLWTLSEILTSQQHAAIYTQAVMDLGATVCTRTKPNCAACPLNKYCLAHLQQREISFPNKKPSRKIPTKNTIMLILSNQKNQFLFEKRPPVGIWGGLWSFPECANEHEIAQLCAKKFSCNIIEIKKLTVFRHTFSHFHLIITPILIKTIKNSRRIMEGNTTNWYYPERLLHQGLPKPVKTLITQILENEKNDKKSKLRRSQSRS